MRTVDVSQECHNLGVVGALIKLIRPKQWTKNLLVFAALLFTGDFRDHDLSLRAFVAFVSMCLVSSSIYVINDLLDVERDRAHPVKKLRPIASGKVPVGLAVMVAALLAGVGVSLAFSLNIKSLAIVCFYLVLQVAYNSGLKHVPLSDVFLIATGFVLRAMLGATAISVVISSWLLFCTGSLALMLGFGKRRHEYMLQGTERSKSRESLSGYNLEALNAFLIMCSVCAAQSYAIYSIQSATAQKYPGMVFTSIFVFYGVFRYVLVAFRSGEGGEPESLLFKDPHILLSIFLFVLTAIAAVKGVHFSTLESAK